MSAIDDQESNIQVVVAALGKLGFEVLSAIGGVQASQRLSVRRPDLILLDLPGACAQCTMPRQPSCMLQLLYIPEHPSKPT